MTECTHTQYIVYTRNKLTTVVFYDLSVMRKLFVPVTEEYFFNPSLAALGCYGLFLGLSLVILCVAAPYFLAVFCNPPSRCYPPLLWRGPGPLLWLPGVLYLCPDPHGPHWHPLLHLRLGGLRQVRHVCCLQPGLVHRHPGGKWESAQDVLKKVHRWTGTRKEVKVVPARLDKS